MCVCVCVILTIMLNMFIVVCLYRKCTLHDSLLNIRLRKSPVTYRIKFVCWFYNDDDDGDANNLHNAPYYNL